MSHMSQEEEKQPGDFERLPPGGLPRLDDDDAPAGDDGFVRPAAAPRSLAQTVQDRKFEASLYRDPEPEAVAQAVGKKGSRSKFMDGAADVMDWASKGMGLVKEADDTAVLYGKDIPDVMEAAGDQFGGLREGADSALEGYAPVQEAFQGIGAWTDKANKALNPLPKISLGKVGGKDIKLGVGTKEILGAASGAMRIRQFQKNEDADPNATAIPERAAVDATQKEFRRALEARRRVGHLFNEAGGYADATGTAMSPESTEDGRVQRLLLAEKKRANLITMQKGMRTALRAGELGKAQEKRGVRSNNEYSMEKSAYLNDREFVPRKPLGFFDDADADKWSPKKGMIKDGEIAKATDQIEASKSVYDRYAKQGAVKGEELPEGLMPGMKDNAGLEALPDDYRDDVEGGRRKQKQVAAARFLGGAGELFEGKMNTDRLVRDGRYGAAYGAKLAELGVITGTKAGAGAAQAGLIAATGGVAAPLLAAAEAGKHLAFHAKEQVGMGMQSASEGLERLIDPKGLAKEQDNRDLYNKHFGLTKPADAPEVGDAPVGDAPVGDSFAEQEPEAAQIEQPAVNPLFAEAAKPQPMNEPYDQVQQILNKKHEYFGMNPEEFQQVQAQRGVPDAQPMPTPEQKQVAEAEEEQQAPAESAPTYEQMTADPSARAADIRERGIHWEKQGDRSVVGRQKRTWARAGKDILWGGAKKVGKGLWEGLKGLVTLPIHAAQWGWKGLKGIGSLFSRKKKAAPENSARAALKKLQEQSKMGDLDRPQFDFSSIQQADIDKMSKEEQDQLRMRREQYDEVFGAKAHAGAQRVGGTRAAAKAALMDKPEVKRAEETAALREQFAPGKYTPRMGSGEILDILRGRARQDIANEEAAAQVPGPGGGGPGDGGDGGGMLDQIAGEDPGDAGGERPVSSDVEMIDTSGGDGSSLPQGVPVNGEQEAAFDLAFGSSARENYHTLNEGAAPDGHLTAAGRGYFPVRQPAPFDPYGEEERLVRQKQDMEQQLADLPSGEAADIADAEALRAHQSRMGDYDARLEEFERADPGAFAGGGERRMAAWDQANPRPERPNTIHDQRNALQAGISKLSDPKEQVAQNWSAHRNGVETYRRRQEYLSRYAPGSAQLNPDMGGYENQQAGNADLYDAYRRGLPRPVPPAPEEERVEAQQPERQNPARIEDADASVQSEESEGEAQPSRRRMSTGPLLDPEQSRGLGTVDRGGGVVDMDLGRALNSTPRLENNMRRYWGDADEDFDPDVDSLDYARDDEFIMGVKDRANRAVVAGQAAGNDAKEFRKKLTKVHEKRSGGVLNPKNWGWVQRGREKKLRAQLQAAYPTPKSLAQGEGPRAIEGQQEVREPSDQGPVAQDTHEPRHRAAAPGKSNLKVRGGGAHTNQTLLPESKAALQAADAAVQEEAAAGVPFAAAGAYAGKHDVTMVGSADRKPRITGAAAQANPLLTGQLLFGVQQASPAVSPEARAGLKQYASAMDKSNAAEGALRSATARQVRADQGSVAMPGPDLTGDLRGFRTPFYNGYWNQEISDPKPTAQARTGKRVHFDATAEQEPLEARDPNRPFAQADAHHQAQKALRAAGTSKQLEALRKFDPEGWVKAGEAGAAVHDVEPRVPFAPVQPQAPVDAGGIEEESEEEKSVRSSADFSDTGTEIVHRGSGSLDDLDEGPIGFGQGTELGDDENGAVGGGPGPMMLQKGANGAWEYREEEQKGVGPGPLVSQAPIPRRQDVRARDPLPQVPSSASRPEYLDTGAVGLRRDQRLMDPRELALLANSANPARAQRQLPAIQSAVKQAQGAETTEAATAAWRKVDELQKGVVNRRWSGYRPSDPANVRAADARTESRRDLMGERMLDVSTSHEGLDLPSARMPDRRLQLGGDEQARIRGFEMPGDDFNMFKNHNEAGLLVEDMYRNPAGYLPKAVGDRGEEEIRGDEEEIRGNEEEVRGKLFKDYGTLPARRKDLQDRFVEREREAAKRVDFGSKRAIDDSGAWTADARAGQGPITVDHQPVYPEIGNLGGDANRDFGGAWRRQDTDQVVQNAGVFGGRGPSPFMEFHGAAIPEDQVLQAPAAGWDAKPKKPGWFAGKEKKAAYQQAKQDRAGVVARAFGAMGRDRAPGYVQGSAFGRQEWARLDLERKARHDALRMRMRGPNVMGNVLFGVVPDPKKPKRK